MPLPASQAARFVSGVPTTGSGAIMGLGLHGALDAMITRGSVWALGLREEAKADTKSARYQRRPRSGPGDLMNRSL